MNGLRHIPLINGVEYSWADVNVSIAGQPIVGITKVDYADDQNIENIYGAGQQPIARGYGNITPTASVTLLRSTIEAIRAGSATGRLQDIAPFDVIVAFIPLNGGAIITHRIRNAQFTKDANSIAQGATKNEVDFPLLPSHIEWR
jgi:hypothetical protein